MESSGGHRRRQCDRSDQRANAGCSAAQLDGLHAGRPILWFVSEVDGAWVNADGTDYRVMVNDLLLDEPAIRPPDGREIPGPDRRRVTLYVMNADARTNVRSSPRLRGRPGVRPHRARYSPDGSVIASTGVV